MLSRKQRLEAIYSYLRSKGLIANKKELSIRLNMPTQASLSRAFNGNDAYLTDALFDRINNAFAHVFSEHWLREGSGNMLSGPDEHTVATIISRKTIPLDNMGKVEPIMLDNIFPAATSAVILNDDAIDIYPRGTIMVLREVKNIDILQWGKDYYIETEEYKLIRCLHQGSNGLTAYGYNTSKHPDGNLVYPPLTIPKESIKKLHIVIGAIVRY